MVTYDPTKYTILSHLMTSWDRFSCRLWLQSNCYTPSSSHAQGQVEDTLPWVIDQECSEDLQNNISYAVALGYPPELEGRSQLLKTHSAYGTRRNHVGTNQEASSMLTSFHNTGRCHLNCWRRKVLQSCECRELHKDQLGKIVSWVQ